MLLEPRIEEFRRYLDNSNLSLATRRAMDLTVDFQELRAFKKEVTSIRKEYNLFRALGSGELEGDNYHYILNSLNNFYEKIVEIERLSPQNMPVTESIVKLENLEKRYKSSKHNFHLGPISFGIDTREITGVVGENGNGKTTLLSILAAETHHSAGEINYQGFEQEELDYYLLKQKIAFIPQRLNSWNGTLKQNLKFSAAIHGIKGEENEERVDFLIHRLGLTRFEDLRWSQLSSGYKLRFELARMMVWNPRFLVLDEPIANLDLVAQQLFLQDIAHLATSIANPVGVILSSQQLHEIEEIADQIIFLKNGSPLFVGAVSDFGKDRTFNSYELSGQFNIAALTNVLSSISGAKIEENGVTFTIHLPLEYKAKQTLEMLLASNLEITYFRDISLSTRKLLSDTL